MCRLLGFVAQPPTTLGHLLGADLTSFTELSMKHGDGWGVATPTDTGVDVRKSTEAARTSRGFATLAREHIADAGMVHLRWATMGLATEWDNTHPFTDGRVAFAHNGSISPPAALDGLIAPDLLDQRRGDTDSERYFLVLLTHLRATPGPRDALAATIAEVSQLHHTSLNCMLITADTLYAVCSYDPAAEDDAEEDSYYRLHYKVHDGTVLVASSGWGHGWTEISNNTMLTVHRGTGAMSMRALFDVRATV